MHTVEVAIGFVTIGSTLEAGLFQALTTACKLIHQSWN